MNMRKRKAKFVSSIKPKHLVLTYWCKGTIHSPMGDTEWFHVKQKFNQLTPQVQVHSDPCLIYNTTLTEGKEV